VGEEGEREKKRKTPYGLTAGGERKKGDSCTTAIRRKMWVILSTGPERRHNEARSRSARKKGETKKS